MKKNNLNETCQVELLPSVDLVALKKKVFSVDEKTKVISIGGEQLTAQMRELYRDQAENLLTTNLWEVIEATIINEAHSLALKGSLNWDHVQFAKGLDYWHTVVSKMLVRLAKK